MTYHRIDNGPEGRPNPPVESLPLQWPVLARLPWVEAAMHGGPVGASPAPTPSEHFPYAGDPPHAPAPPALRIAETTAGALSPASSRTFDAEPYDAAAAVASTPTPQPKRQYRIDPGDGRIVAAAISRVQPSVGTATVNGRPSIASRLFQVHAALAPHAGVALTFFLALTAGLLYWRTAASTSTAMIAPPAQPLAWSTEATTPAAEAAPAADDWQPSPPAYDVPEMSWPLSPRVTLDAAPLTAAVSVPALDSAESLANDLADEAEQNKTASQAFIAKAADPEITPTPATPAAAAPLSYPSTPFALIDPHAVRSDDAPAVAAEPSAPAEGSVDGGSPPGSPR